MNARLGEPANGPGAPSRRSKSSAPSFLEKAIALLRGDTAVSKVLEQKAILESTEETLCSPKPKTDNPRRRTIEVGDEDYFQALKRAKGCKTPDELKTLAEEYVSHFYILESNRR